MERSDLLKNQVAASASNFDHLQVAGEDPIFGLKRKVEEDTNPLKVDMGLGAYMDNTGKQPVWKAVRIAEEMLVEEKLDKDYLSLLGNETYIKFAQELIFGKSSEKYQTNAIASGQTISGTGSLRLAGEFLKKCLSGCEDRDFYLPKETWPNHSTIFQRAGWVPKAFPYYDRRGQCLAETEILAAMREAKSGSVFLFHACAMNPTATDPSQKQWDSIVAAAKENNLFLMFDCAYLGWASGDMDTDAYGMRAAEAAGLEFAVSQSYSKNLALYGERVGAIHVVCTSADRAASVRSELQAVIRPLWSNCPLQGTRIALKVLGNTDLRAMWMTEFKEACQRLLDVRKEFYRLMQEKKTPGNWDFIVRQQGYFIFTNLNRQQCETMEKKYRIYNLLNGRFSLCGVNTSNIQRVADAFDQITRDSA